MENKHLRRAIEYLNDPYIYLSGRVVVLLWDLYTEKEANNALNLIIDCLWEQGIHCEVTIQLGIQIRRIEYVYETDLFIIQFANNKTLTNDTGRGNSRGGGR